MEDIHDYIDQVEQEITDKIENDNIFTIIKKYKLVTSEMITQHPCGLCCFYHKYFGCQQTRFKEGILCNLICGDNFHFEEITGE